MIAGRVSVISVGSTAGGAETVPAASENVSEVQSLSDVAGWPSLAATLARTVTVPAARPIGEN